jgi:hypothetical protein
MFLNHNLLLLEFLFLLKIDFFILSKSFPAAPVLSFILSSNRCDFIQHRYLKFLTCSSYFFYFYLMCLLVSIYYHYFHLLLVDFHVP